MNISFSLPHLVHFCDGVRKEETHFTDKMSPFYLQKSLLLDGCWGGEGRQRVPGTFLVGTFQLHSV